MLWINRCLKPIGVIEMVMKKAFQKLNSSKGFTLTETLATLVIMSLVGIMVTAGIVTAVRVYREVTDYANAQVLMTNTLTLLNDTLIYADPAEVPDYDAPVKSISFKNIKGKDINIVSNPGDEAKKGICISYGGGSKEPLITYVSNEDMNIYTDWEISTSDIGGSSKGKVFIINLFVKPKSGDEVITRIENYRVETINS